MSDEFRNEHVIAEATFRKKSIITYQIASTSIALLLTVVGIVLIPIAILIIKLIGPKIVDTWACTLTNRAVHVKKGFFVKVKKTIPLEKITDVGSVQGPIMRKFGLYSLSFETAGQSGGSSGGALVKLLGIDDSESFRDLVLDTRDTAAGPAGSASPDSTTPGVDSDQDLLREIRDSLLRIEDHISQGD